MFEENTQKTSTNTEPSLTQDELNIFKEFSGDLDFGPEKVVLNKEIVKKDKMYYFGLGSKIFTIVNVLGVIILISYYLFLNIQNDNQQSNKSYLNPFCSIFLGEDYKNSLENCSSVSALIIDYNAKQKELTNTISKKISLMLDDIYLIDNFMNSKEVTFLLNEKTSKLKVLEVLNDFDKLKNDFTKTDKGSIVCKGINIDEKSVLSVTCDAYSSSWESSDGGIIGDSGESNSSIEGTSITRAVSFLNFIEKNPTYNFQIIEKQSDFDSEIVVGQGVYVRKTTFAFKLKYNSINDNLSL